MTSKLDPTKWQQINEWTWESIRDEPREIRRPDEMIRRALQNAPRVTENRKP